MGLSLHRCRGRNLPIDDDVAGAVYEALGIGIPHHVQSFFAHLRQFAIMQGRDRVTAEDVGQVYRTEPISKPTSTATIFRFGY